MVCSPWKLCIRSCDVYTRLPPAEQKEFLLIHTQDQRWFVPNSNEKDISTPIKLFATWAVVLMMTVAALIALVLIVRVFYRDDMLFTKLVTDHVRAIVGVPMAAASAFCVLLVFEVRGGRMEFEALGFHFRGGSGPAVIWVFAFLAFAAAIRLLWG
jgi:hypothetical protein